MRLVVLCFAALAFTAPPAFAQEKKTDKKAQKKQAEPKQDWGHFNTGAKKDMKAMEKKKAAEKK